LGRPARDPHQRGRAEDFKIVTAPPLAPGRENWRDLVPHKPGRYILVTHPFSGHLVRVEREDGLPRIVHPRQAGRSGARARFRREAYALDVAATTNSTRRSCGSCTRRRRRRKQTVDYDMADPRADLTQAAEGAERP